MDTDTPVIDFYKRDFVDPLYAPYTRTNVLTQGGNCSYNINPHQKMGCNVPVAPPQLMKPSPWINPEQIEYGWDKRFVRQNPWYPCPIGWKAANPDGFCVREDLEHEPIFYTEKNYSVENFFPQRYQPKLQILQDNRPIQYPEGHKCWGENAKIRQSKYSAANTPYANVLIHNN